MGPKAPQDLEDLETTFVVSVSDLSGQGHDRRSYAKVSKTPQRHEPRFGRLDMRLRPYPVMLRVTQNVPLAWLMRVRYSKVLVQGRGRGFLMTRYSKFATAEVAI